jgi:ATP-dependent RNA helicase RhlE
VNAARIHGNRSQAQRTEALAGFKSGKYRVLVATDIAARGIDVEALSHVVNFDVPAVAEDYIHRVGRTGRAELTGDAFTFVSPEEEGDLRAIERAVKATLPRITLPDFDYKSRPQQKFEIPLAQRIAEIRARKAEERARARANQERRASNTGQAASGQNRTAPQNRPVQTRSNQNRSSQNRPGGARPNRTSNGPASASAAPSNRRRSRGPF